MAVTITKDVVQAPARKPLSVFAVALVQERARFRSTRHQVATQCGVQYSQVESWEKGESVPDVQTFKRLVGLFRRLAATPPNWGGTGERATLADKAAIDIQREVQKIKEPEKVPAPESFGSGLKRIRMANRMSLADLGEVVGLGGTSIANWESDRNAPYAYNLGKLYEVLPELKAAIEVGSVRRPMSGNKPVEAESPQLSIVKSEPANASNAVAEAKPAEAPAMIAPEEHARVMSERRPVRADSIKSIAELATAYGLSRAAMLVAKRRLDELRGKLAEAQLESDRANAAHDQALADLDARAAEPDK
jgi:transcriptional regulator with XRE-family HTH domain